MESERFNDLFPPICGGKRDKMMANFQTKEGGVLASQLVLLKSTVNGIVSALERPPCRRKSEPIRETRRWRRTSGPLA